MTYSTLRYNSGEDTLDFSVLKDGQDIKCRIEELWMQQECGYKPDVDLMTGSLEKPLKKAFAKCWPTIEKRIAQRIENKQVEPDGTIFLKGN